MTPTRSYWRAVDDPNINTDDTARVVEVILQFP